MSTTLLRIMQGLALAGLTAGCGDPSAPGQSLGAIALTISTTGHQLDFDRDGYLLRVDGGTPIPYSVNVAVIFDSRVGLHVLTFEGFAPNCTPVGGNQISVDVGQGTAAGVILSVVCAPNVGKVEVTTATLGNDPDPNGYVVTLTGLKAVPISANGSVTIENVRAGTYGVSLGDVSGNCALDGAQHAASVSFGATTSVPFEIRCVTSGTVLVTAATTGVDLDADGYTVELRRDGSAAAVQVEVQANGSATRLGMLPGTYAVTLSGMSPNCATGTPVEPAISIAAGSQTQLTLAVRCATSPQLAFVNGTGDAADIYLVNSNGAGSKRLTTQSGADVDPSWSPDGSRIVFSSHRDGNLEIYSMDADGGNPKRLTDRAGDDYRPAWSPDGARIAFVSHRDGSPEIYVMNADGSKPVRLTNNATTDGDPAWSPDGTMIAFRSNRDGSGRIWIMNADGTDAHALTSNSIDDSQPAWSPDGTRIAFSRGASSVERDIFVVTVSAPSLATQLTFGVLSASDPAWSPDGKLIALGAVSGRCYSFYYDYYSCDPYIMIVRMDGGTFTFAPLHAALDPAWRP